MGTEGDSFFVVFPTAEDAVTAAVQAQRDLAEYPWPGGDRWKVRMGIHTGSPQLHDGEYVGMDVHRAARIAASAHGGQVLVSQATAHLVDDRLPDGVGLRDLGSHRLKDISAAEHLFQVTIEGLRTDFAPLKTLGTVSSLPRPATRLVGRDGELAELSALLKAPGVRLVTLTGLGGSGKTRLAIGLAQRLVEAFPDGVYFVPLVAATGVDEMWTSIAEMLDVPPESRIPPGLFSHVAHRSALFVLDNLEQLDGADEVVSQLLAAAPAVVVVATSRRPLRVAGELQHAVPPLELPDGVGLEDAERSGAVQLFVQHARAVRASFTLTVENATDVVRVCRRLDGLPLAIELAAARSKLLSPAALVKRLDKALELKDAGVDRPTRQQTLQRAIGWSYDLLNPQLRAFFCQLGVFAGGCDLDSIAAVVEAEREPLDDIAELVDLSLLTIAEDAAGEPRVRMLHIVADFARERLTERGELDLVRQRHAEHYLALAEALAPQMPGRELTARDRIGTERENLRAALTWALQPGEPASGHHRVTIGLRLVAVLWEFWLAHGYLVEGRRWLERAVEAGSDNDGEAMASALFGLSAMPDPGRNPARRRALLARSLSISQDIGDQTGVARAMIGLATVHQAAGELDTAHELFEHAIMLSHQVSSDSVLAEALSLLANLELRFGRLDRARELTEESRTVAKRAGNDHIALLADIDSAWVLTLTGEAPQSPPTSQCLGRRRTRTPRAVGQRRPDLGLFCGFRRTWRCRTCRHPAGHQRRDSSRRRA